MWYAIHVNFIFSVFFWTNVQSERTTRAEPEDHLWSADHSLRNAALIYLLQLHCKNAHIIRTRPPTDSLDTQFPFSYYHRLIGEEDMAALFGCMQLYIQRTYFTVSCLFLVLCSLFTANFTFYYPFSVPSIYPWCLLYIRDVCCIRAVKCYHVHTDCADHLIDCLHSWWRHDLTTSNSAKLSLWREGGWVGTSPVVLDDPLKENMDTKDKVIQKNQLDATIIYWSIRSAQHVSGNLLPIIRSVRLGFLQHMVICCCGRQGVGELSLTDSLHLRNQVEVTRA